MAKPDFEWTLAEAPDEAEVSRPVGAPERPRRVDGRPRQWWRWLLVVSLLLAGAALAMRVITWRGEQNILAQLTAEVTYEDEQARAGDVAAAMSAWFKPPQPLNADKPNTAWWLRRQAEAELGLAAPLPWPGLTPVDAPPRVTGATPLASGADQWDVTVVRAYIDTAGKTFEFALTQRYQNVGPGLWQRVPPDVTGLAAMTYFPGRRLSVTLPEADWPELIDSLLAADALLERACTEWGADMCSGELVPLIFTADPITGPAPLMPASGASARLGPYPLALEIGALVPSYRQQIITLLSPHLSGLALTETDHAAVTQALTVIGLLYLANVQTSPSLRAEDYFRDAMVARAEQRLGLAGPMTYRPTAADYRPMGLLWEPTQTATPPAVALPRRLQALQFLNGALANQSATVDAALLAALHRRPTLATWLVDVLGEREGRGAEAAWQAIGDALYTEAHNLDWHDLDGLSYSCTTRTEVVHQSAPQWLPTSFFYNSFGLEAIAVSPQGRYVAYVQPVSGPLADLVVYDLSAQTAVTVSNQVTLETLWGWSSESALVYAERRTPEEAGAPAQFLYYAQRYDPATGDQRTLIGAALSFYDPQWLPDRRSLVVVARLGGNDWDPLLLPVDDAGPPQLLLVPSLGMRPAPDGARVAYTALGMAGTARAEDEIETLTLATGERRLVLSLATLRADYPTLVDVTGLQVLAWSGDSAWLLVTTSGSASQRTTVLVVPADGSGPAREVIGIDPGEPLQFVFDAGHSADGRYLSLRTRQPEGGTIEATLYMIDLEALDSTGPVTAQWVADEVAGAGWSPTKPQLAYLSAGAVRVSDLATGNERWVIDDNCQALIWYALTD